MSEREYTSKSTENPAESTAAAADLDIAPSQQATAEDPNDNSAFASPTYLQHDKDSIDSVAPGKLDDDKDAANVTGTNTVVAPNHQHKHHQKPHNVHKSYPRVDLVMDELLAEGGFCSIWEIQSIQDLENGEWVLAPATNTSTSLDANGENPSSSKKRAKGQHQHRKGTASFGSFGGAFSSPSSFSPGNHRRNATTPSAVSSSELPPSIKSMDLTVIRPFVDSKNHASLSTDQTQQSRHTSSNEDIKAKHRALFKSKDSSTDSNDNSDKNNGPLYVMKCLKPKAFRNVDILHMALNDMRVEIEMLQRMHHPNIVSLKAFGSMQVETYSSYQEQRLSDANAKGKQIDDNNDDDDATSPPEDPRYPFIILDRLGDTLQTRFQGWQAKHKKASSVVGKMITHRKHSKANFQLLERLAVLCDLSSALAYMHRHKIIYRDLKPENIGFDIHHDELKVFDLGLAKDLSNLEADSSGLYRLTALTGSARYMAPEVAREEPYNEKCDVYGLAIIIWQVMVLEIPYTRFNMSKMFQQVYDCPHVRPSLEEWAESDDFQWLVKLLSIMWSPLIEDRPSIEKVRAALNKQYLRCREHQAEKGQIDA